MAKPNNSAQKERIWLSNAYVSYMQTLAKVDNSPNPFVE
jgi:hypothetical protein